MSGFVASDSADLENLVHWACCNGVVMANKVKESDNLEAEYVTRDVAHAPFALMPYVFSETIFQRAMHLAPLFNQMVDKIARNEEWLVEHLKVAAEGDEFTSRLLEILKQTQTVEKRQMCYFGIHRSDYMLHEREGETSESFLQVELNTIASSFAALSTKISLMYRSVYGERYAVPINEALDGLVMGIHCAHHEYVNQTGSFQAVVLFLVQAKERNFADQRHVQHVLLERYKIESFRATFADVTMHAHVDGVSGMLLFKGMEVSLVYFRAGYSPDDYASQSDWSARTQIELSNCIKCPNIAYHLAGTKKVQQVLAIPGMLERFLDTNACSLLRSVFAGLYSLSSEDSIDGDLTTIIGKALAQPEAYVMKPQREGGGNNLYGQEMVHALMHMSPKERSAYILMERIHAPVQQSCLVRNGLVMACPCICELGIYGVYIGYGSNDPVMNESAGFLLRVKPASSDEGGVNAGFSVLSSPFFMSQAKR